MSGDTSLLQQRLIFSGVVLLVMGVFSMMIGFGLGGFDSQHFLFQYFLYVGSGVLALVGIWFFLSAERLISDGDDQYGENFGFYEPKEALIPLKFFDRPFALAYFSFIIFSIISFISVVRQNTAFTGIASLQQQFSPLGSSLFNTFLVTTSENLTGAFVLVATVLGIRHLARKYEWGSETYTPLVMFFGPIAVGFLGFANHLLRYGTSDFNMLIVFAFWTLGGLISLLTGSFIPFWMAHIANNVFVEMDRVLTDTVIFATTIGVLVVMTLLGFVMFFGKKRGGDNE